MSEATVTVTYCTQRDGGDDIHLECRMSDGQKGAFVAVSAEFPELAQRICEYLNQAARPEALPSATWIPCSERTPDQDGRLWAVLSDTVNCGHVTGYYPLYEYYHFDNGWATDERITHWLEVKLPAMPSVPSPLARRGDEP